MRLLINEQIKKSGLKKKYIADKLNVNKDTLSNWIAGRSMIPLDRAVHLAEILNCDIKDLYER
ncbi:helix-turn-helix domain-containing protein [Lentibacillus salicampi]|uniref:XRE family transcriptional regulator n=1 Tax=Lentibacillus salicampi TaxID=175306 RepID=A0A4Y9A7W6_9BACI|nr:helix-turn-helix transcriptional regulator [Lentibacillus salicampi]TFJ91833.1 XRE family transcriptional regulator [Lentibacillus salicampi]